MKDTKLPQTEVIMKRNRREGEMRLDVANCSLEIVDSMHIEWTIFRRKNTLCCYTSMAK